MNGKMIMEIMRNELGEAELIAATEYSGEIVRSTIENWGEISAIPAYMGEGWDIILYVFPSYRAQWGLGGATIEQVTDPNTLARSFDFLARQFVAVTCNTAN